MYEKCSHTEISLKIKRFRQQNVAQTRLRNFRSHCMIKWLRLEKWGKKKLISYIIPHQFGGKSKIKNTSVFAHWVIPQCMHVYFTPTMLRYNIGEKKVKETRERKTSVEKEESFRLLSAFCGFLNFLIKLNTRLVKNIQKLLMKSVSQKHASKKNVFFSKKF